MNDSIYIEVGNIRIDFTANGTIQVTTPEAKFAAVRISRDSMMRIAQFYMKVLHK